MPNLPAARAAIAQIEPDARVHDLTDEELASIVEAGSRDEIDDLREEVSGLRMGWIG